jgi:hypothetical protein
LPLPLVNERKDSFYSFARPDLIPHTPIFLEASVGRPTAPVTAATGSSSSGLPLLAPSRPHKHHHWIFIQWPTPVDACSRTSVPGHARRRSTTPSRPRHCRHWTFIRRPTPVGARMRSHVAPIPNNARSRHWKLLPSW